MKTATLTISGKIGPGFTVTSLVIPGVVSIDFQIARNVIAVTVDQQKTRFFDYDATATITYVITGDNAVITVS